jgi:hypothetical protein
MAPCDVHYDVAGGRPDPDLAFRVVRRTTNPRAVSGGRTRPHAAHAADGATEPNVTREQLFEPAESPDRFGTCGRSWSTITTLLALLVYNRGPERRSWPRRSPANGYDRIVLKG